MLTTEQIFRLLKPMKTILVYDPLTKANYLLSVDEREKIIVQYIKKHGFAGSRDIEALLNIAAVTANKHLRSLAQKKILTFKEDKTLNVSSSGAITTVIRKIYYLTNKKKTAE